MALLNPSAQQVYDLIALTNVATWPVTAVALNYATPVAEVGHPTGKNTSLVVSAGANTEYVGSVTVNYNRLDLAGFETNYGSTSLVVPEGATAAQIVAAFNAFYDASLDTSDYVDNAPGIPPDYDGETYTLVAAAGSLAYINSVVLDIQLATTQLSSILTVTDLNGLTFPVAP